MLRLKSQGTAQRLRNMNMIRTAILGLCLLSGFIGTAQTVLPNAILDTMIFEVKRGRQCDIALQASQAEIQALGIELVHTGKALELSQSGNVVRDSLIENQKRGKEILSLQFSKDLKEEKNKTKRWRKVAFGEAVLVVIGVLILL